MADFTSNKLDLNSLEDKKQIDAVKKKLQSINQDDIKDKLNFVRGEEEFMKN